jgi:hypothetical protein
LWRYPQSGCEIEWKASLFPILPSRRRAVLFRPTADQRLDGILSMLEVWNDEADRFRAVAIAARKGETPPSLTVAEVEEAHDGLLSLLDEIDRAIEGVPPGDRAFADLLRAQSKAVSLLESVTNSMDVLSPLMTDDQPGPVRIGRQPLRQAAE